MLPEQSADAIAAAKSASSLPTSAVDDEAQQHSAQNNQRHTAETGTATKNDIRRLQKEKKDLENLVKRLKDEKVAAVREKEAAIRDKQNTARGRDHALQELNELKGKAQTVSREYRKASADLTASQIRCADMGHKLNNVRSQYAQLEQEYSIVYHKYAETQKEANHFHNEFLRIKSSYDPLMKRCKELDSDNDLLRSQIATMGSAEDPVYEENHYILQFDQLNSDIESWTAKETKQKPVQLTSDNLQELVKWISTFGNLSPKATTALNSELLIFHDSPFQLHSRPVYVRSKSPIVGVF